MRYEDVRGSRIAERMCHPARDHPSAVLAPVIAAPLLSGALALD